MTGPVHNLVRRDSGAEATALQPATHLIESRLWNHYGGHTHSLLIPELAVMSPPSLLLHIAHGDRTCTKRHVPNLHKATFSAFEHAWSFHWNLRMKVHRSCEELPLGYCKAHHGRVSPILQRGSPERATGQWPWAITRGTVIPTFEAQFSYPNAERSAQTNEVHD